MRFDAEKWRTEQKEKLNAIHQQIAQLAEYYESNPEDIAELMAFNSNFYQYSVNNTMLIFSQNPGATYVGSYKALKDKGWNVKKGEKAIKILVPVVTTLFRPDRNTPFKQLRDATKNEKVLIQAGKMETMKKTSFKAGNIFDISQTDCPKDQYPKLIGIGESNEASAAAFQNLSAYCTSIGTAVQLSPLSSVSLRGYYAPEENQIVVNDILDDTQRFSTLAHELGHALLHQNSAIDDTPTELKEVEADSLGIMLEKTFNLELSDPRKNHLKSNYDRLKKYNQALIANEQSPFSLDKIVRDVSTVFENHFVAMKAYMEQDKEAIAAHQAAQNENNHRIAISDNVELRDIAMDEDRYLHFTALSDGYGLDGLFRVSDPSNGDDMTLVNIENGYLHPDIALQWEEITKALTDYSYKGLALDPFALEQQAELEL